MSKADNKIRIIDLLNKIANGEEVPKEIKYAGIIYNYVRFNKEGLKYANLEKKDDDVFKFLITNVNKLDDEVEILEDNTEEIAELDEWVTRRDGEVTQQEGKRLEMCYKINELVKSVNKLKKEQK